MIVCKYSVPLVERSTLAVPERRRFLSAQGEGVNIWVWFLVDPKSPLIPLELRAVGTDVHIDDAEAHTLRYLATVLRGGRDWHLFEVLSDALTPDLAGRRIDG